jgi:hypothetical protein
LSTPVEEAWESATTGILVPEKYSKRSDWGKILVGTASWSDPDFVEHWYPNKMPAANGSRARPIDALQLTAEVN